MKKEELIELSNEVTAELLEVADEFIEEITKQFSDVGNPEKLIGKPYETWTPQDLMMLSQIYGTEEPNKLSTLIFNKSYEQIKALEAEELQ